MGYAIMQIVGLDGTYHDWDGQIVVKSVRESHVLRVEGNDVNLPGSADTGVAVHNVPVGKVHKVFRYAFSPDSTGVDKFLLKVGAAVKTTVYTRTYDGGDLDDYILIDNSAGTAAVVVVLVAHNGDPLAHKGSGHILIEDVTDTQAP